ncbi:hypothetical protein J8F10_16405 [Gemmata sp. G18]|uniref:Uncharacterized protein n=1 Tax=Gemmata palustris TaxID=2822762 RepID=A0ABS5BU86_9BACT|nr:hypothetical protein [Gemmata palustris]MBP3956855.1 hypothetical protein [Gemmata palustris]
MAKSKSGSTESGPAAQLAERLRAGVRDEQTAPPPGARDQDVLTGLTPSGQYRLPVEVVVRSGIDALRASGRVYGHGGTIVFDTTAPSDEPALVPLRSEARVEPAAGGLLANILVCGGEVKGQPVWFPLPSVFLQVLLNAEPLARELPRIDLYARRALFGPDYELLNPGYHPGPRYLIHGAPVEPDVAPLPHAEAPVERLPPHLNRLLSGFCFRDAADSANALALLITGVLVNHFVEGGKPVALIDGTQPGLGKTLLVRVIGMVLDGVDPRPIHYTPDDEELQKRICATLRPNRQSVVLIDNAKSPTGTPISSPAVEANSMAPEISLRILGVSQNYVRPNDAIWALTMNQTRVSPDLVSRGLPIRLEYIGDPARRAFGRADPIAYARTHRPEILAELFGFVVRWTQQGRPRGAQAHRLHGWAEVIGGIMTANGFPAFLANYDEAAATFNSELEELSTLVEIVLADPNGPHVTTP